MRVFDLPKHGFATGLAESIFALDFSDADSARIEELNGRANEGDLTAEQEAELEAYIDVGDLLAYWHSKARQSLQRPA